MQNELNTITEFELSDGTKVNMTLNYWALYQLKPKDNKIYDEYNRVMTTGTKKDLDMTVILYTAYLCANLDSECMKYEEFLKKCPVNRAIIRATVGALTMPKKQ